MAEGFYLRYETTDAVATYETLAAAGTVNQPYITQNAVVGIFNAKGSDCVTTVKRIEINELQARTTTLPNNLSIFRTTAQTGGESLTVTKHDTNDADLSALVSIVKYPGSVTTTGDNIRRLLGRNGLSPATAFNAFCAPRLGDVKGSLSHAIAYNNFEAGTQGIVIREGEGIAITTGLVAPANFPLEFVIKINNGSATYSVTTVVKNSAMVALIGIFNAVGSGETLTIARIDFSEIRTVDILPAFTVESISGLYGGTAISPISLDTNNTAIPSGVQIVSNCAVDSASINSSTSIRSQISGDGAIRRITPPAFGVGVALASGLIPFLRRKHVVFDFSPAVDSSGGFVLREGEGIAIFNKPNACGYINYEIILYLTNVYTPPTPGGGGYVYNIFE